MENLSTKLNHNITISGIDIGLWDHIKIEGLQVNSNSSDSIFHIDNIDISIDDFSIIDKNISIDDITINSPFINIESYYKIIERNSSNSYKVVTDSLNIYPLADKIDELIKNSSKSWKVAVDRVIIESGEIHYTANNIGNIGSNRVEDQPSSIITDDMDIIKFNSSIKLPSKEDRGLHIEKISFTNIDGPSIDNIQSTISQNSSEILINNTLIETTGSYIDIPEIILSKRDIDSNNSSKLSSIVKRITINPTSISTDDISIFNSKTSELNDYISIQGEFYQEVNNIKGEEIKLKYSNLLSMDGNFALLNIDNESNSELRCNITSSHIDLKLLDIVESTFAISIPKDITNKGIVTYTGELIERDDRIISNGVIGGSFGTVKTNINTKRVKKGIDIDGNLLINRFKLGKILSNRSIGEVTSNIKLKGIYKNKSSYLLELHGSIDTISINEKKISSIYINGVTKPGTFIGDVTINDPNISIYFSGSAIDINSKKRAIYKFNSNIDKIDLEAFGLDTLYNIKEVSTSINANFSATDIDNLNGYIDISSLNIKQKEGFSTLSDIQIKAKRTEGNKTVSFTSDFADASIDGNFNFKDLKSDITLYISKYISALKGELKPNSINKTCNFTVEAEIKRIPVIIASILPNIDISEGTTLKGYFNADENTHKLDISIPKFNYDDNIFWGTRLRSSSIDGRVSSRLNIDNGATGKNGRLNIENISLLSEIYSDTIDLGLSWSNTDSITYSGNIVTSTVINGDPNRNDIIDLDIDISKSNIWIADSLWVLSKSSISVRDSSTTIRGLSFYNNDQRLELDGVYANNSTNPLKVKLNNISLSNIDLISSRKLYLNGSVNVDATVDIINGHTIPSIDMSVIDFSLRDSIIGTVKLQSKWAPSSNRLEADLNLINNGRRSLEAHGFYTPENRVIDIESEAKSLPFYTLASVLRSFANNLDGEVNGKLSLKGPISNPVWDGKLKLDNGKLGIISTQVIYSIDDTIKFKGDKIIFDDIDIYDEEMNHGVISGDIQHNLFKNLQYNIRVQGDNIIAMDIPTEVDGNIYGKVIATGNIDILGHFEDLRLIINASSGDGTDLKISLSEPASAAKNNFLTFVKPVDNNIYVQRSWDRDEAVVAKSHYTMDFNITATPDAKLTLIFDRITGDMLTGSGSGELKIRYVPGGEFTMNGDYNIDEGLYTFALKNYILSKRFKLRQGGTITWVGDPYKGVIDAEAVYNTRASLYNLLQESDNIDYTKRIKIDCIIHLTKHLENPDVGFAIGLPTADERTKSEVSQYLTTDDDVTTQMLSLLITGQFTTPTYLASGSNSSIIDNNVVGSTASEMLSSQLTNILSNLTNSIEMGLSYRPGDQVTNKQVEVALSTQLLNNRMTLNGNIGNSSGINSNSSNDIIGELEMYYKVNKSGKLQLKAYNRSNDDLVYTTALYTQGVGITYREEFNNISDLATIYLNRRERRRRDRAKRKRERRERAEQKRQSIDKKDE